MTSLSANASPDRPDPMNVVFIVYPDIVLLDLVGPLQVFTHTQRDAQAGPAYQTHVISGYGGSIATQPVRASRAIRWMCGKRVHTSVVIGGDGRVTGQRGGDNAGRCRAGAVAHNGHEPQGNRNTVRISGR